MKVIGLLARGSAWMVCVALLACIPDVDEAPDFSVRLEVLADGKVIDANGDSIPSGAAQIALVATVTAPTGEWNLKVDASGALATVSGSEASVHFLSDAATGEVRLQVPLRAALPQGTGAIRVVLGNRQLGATYSVAPTDITLEFLRVGLDAGTLTADRSWDDVALDGGSKRVLLPLPAGEADKLHVGEQFTIRVSSTVAPTVEGSSLTGSLDSLGGLKLGGDGTAHSSVPFQFTKGKPVAEIPASVTSAGTSAVTASARGARSVTKYVDAVSAVLAVREVEFVEARGLGALNRVTVCSSRAAGTVQAAVDTGTLITTSAMLETRGASACPAGLTQANFLWVGARERVTWTLTDPASQNSVLALVPTVGTGTGVVLIIESSAWSQKPPTPEGLPGNKVGQVVVRLSRIPDANGFDVGTELAMTPVELKPASSLVVEPLTTNSDRSGVIVVRVEVPPTTRSIALPMLVDGIATAILSVNVP
jgi:hypothetical protein